MQTARQSCWAVSYLLLFCCTSAIFCGSLELSVSCQQTSFWPLLLSLLLMFWAWLRPGFIQKTLQPLLFSLPSPDLHSTGLNPISQVGLSGFPGEESYPKNINWPQDFLGDWFLDPSSSPFTLHNSDPLYNNVVSPTISMLMTHSSIINFNQRIK